MSCHRFESVLFAEVRVPFYYFVEKNPLSDHKTATKLLASPDYRTHIIIIMMDHFPSARTSIPTQQSYTDEEMMVEVREGSSSSSSARRVDGNPLTFRPIRNEQHCTNSLPSTMSRNHRTKSIPISTSLRRSSSAARIDQIEAEADYQDYLFFSRIVSGIASNQSKLPDGHIKYENELTLNNIIRTRHEDSYNNYNYNLQDSSRKLHSAYGAASPFFPSPLNLFPSEYDPAEDEDDDAYESGVFDMDL
jgi:hypothetical protein